MLILWLFAFVCTHHLCHDTFNKPTVLLCYCVTVLLLPTISTMSPPNYRSCILHHTGCRGNHCHWDHSTTATTATTTATKATAIALPDLSRHAPPIIPICRHQNIAAANITTIITRTTATAVATTTTSTSTSRKRMMTMMVTNTTTITTATATATVIAATIATLRYSQVNVSLHYKTIVTYVYY